MPATLPTLDVTPAVRTALQETRTALRDLYDDRLVRLIVFGSQARGEAHAESDVDVLIVLDAPVDALTEARRTSGLIMDIASRHGVALSFVHLSGKEFAHKDRPLLRNIDREGVVL
ncbi:nucleotidyltransferase [Longimonas halophila]|uniref:Nucleotidyltransferase n=1 Tax=Longimonas halophila TaxID=1469170 RepID=A0A2H3P1N2_9BACT|nr:nucleotidyltransferase domain-containing protein [Longimonas halophila]PEN04751.1 nucleotidyltransferase [Longimonas halophila]